jgi:hypothetical protein
VANVAAIQRLDEIEHVGDIAVVSQFDPETGEIAACEELVPAPWRTGWTPDPAVSGPDPSVSNEEEAR